MVTTHLPRILLVHGALADGSSWSKVIPHLHQAGLSVTAVEQPLTGIPNDIAVVKAGLATLNNQSSEPIIVVGHSFGGLVISNAARDVPNVAGLVYVQGFAPDEGETVAELSAEYPHLPSNDEFVPVSDGRVVLSEQDFLQYFAPDLPKEEARVYAAVQGPFDTLRFGFVNGAPAWKQVKNLHYIVGSDDQIITPELQSFLAKRMGAKTTTIKASHIGLVSHAKQVAEVIIAAAHAVAK